jgi:hypothetical protein
MKGSATSSQCEVVLAEGESRDDLALVLTLGSILEGRVLDPAGNPVPGVSVMVFREGVPRDEMTTQDAYNITRADGTFHLQGLREGTYSVIVEPFMPAAENSGAEFSYKVWRGVSAGSRDVSLVLPAADWIEGTIVDPDGNPAAGARVQAQAAEDESSDLYLPSSSAHSDAQGRFRIKVCASGRTNLQVFSAPRAGSAGWQPVDVRIKLAPWR